MWRSIITAAPASAIKATRRLSRSLRKTSKNSSINGESIRMISYSPSQALKIAITGAGGQLGFDLIRVLSKEHKLFALSKSDMNVINAVGVMKCIREICPDVV